MSIGFPSLESLPVSKELPSISFRITLGIEATCVVFIERMTGAANKRRKNFFI
jgi:hypothetical protein